MSSEEFYSSTYNEILALLYHNRTKYTLRSARKGSEYQAWCNGAAISNLFAGDDAKHEIGELFPDAVDVRDGRAYALKKAKELGDPVS